MSVLFFLLYKRWTACTLKAMSPFLTCFPYHRSPSACLEGTHGDRVAGDNANAIDFVTIASSLCATSSTRIDCYRSLFMSLVRGRKESKLVRSLVLYVKLGARFLAAVAARTPNKHIPLISTLFRPLQGVNGVNS